MLIIQGSHRKTGSTAAIVEILAQELKADVIHLADKEIAHFKYEGTTQDDFRNFIEEMILHDDIIWATPIYWYTMSGMMKTLLDRISDLLKWDKELGRKLRGLKMHVVSVSGHDDAPESFIYPFKMSADYLGMKFGSYFHAWGDEGVLTKISVERARRFIEEIS